MTLRSIAQELCEPHLTMIGERIGKVPGLIAELREAVSGSSDTGSGGSSSKARILVDASALDLLNNITDEVRIAYTNRYQDAAPTLETCITKISQDAHEPDWETTLEATLNWAKDQIETYLRPKKLRRLDGVTCPSCGQSTYSEDRLTALYVDCWADNENLKPHQEWTVECKACETNWTGTSEIKWVLVALTAHTC